VDLKETGFAEVCWIELASNETHYQDSALVVFHLLVLHSNITISTH